MCVCGYTGLPWAHEFYGDTIWTALRLEGSLRQKLNKAQSLLGSYQWILAYIGQNTNALCLWLIMFIQLLKPTGMNRATAEGNRFFGIGSSFQVGGNEQNSTRHNFDSQSSLMICHWRSLEAFPAQGSNGWAQGEGQCKGQGEATSPTWQGKCCTGGHPSVNFKATQDKKMIGLVKGHQCFSHWSDSCAQHFMGYFWAASYQPSDLNIIFT